MAAPTQERVTYPPVQASTPDKTPLFPAFSVIAPPAVIFGMFVAVSTNVDILAREKMPRQTLLDLADKLLDAVGGQRYDPEKLKGKTAQVQLDANEMGMIKKSVDGFPWQVAGRVARSGDQRQALTDAHRLFQRAFEAAAGIPSEPVSLGAIRRLADLKRQT